MPKRDASAQVIQSFAYACIKHVGQNENFRTYNNEYNAYDFTSRLDLNKYSILLDMHFLNILSECNH